MCPSLAMMLCRTLLLCHPLENFCHAQLMDGGLTCFLGGFLCVWFFPPLILESALFACTMHWKSLSKSEIIQLCIASASCTRMALKWHMLAVVAHFRLCLCMQSPPLSTPSAALPADQQPLLLCKALVLALLCSIHTWQSPVGPRL